MIVPATEELIERFYADKLWRPNVTTKSLVALKDGEPIGVAGGFVQPDDGLVVFFGDFTDELRKRKVTLYRLAQAGRDWALSLGTRAYALADPAVENSERLLERLGGRLIGHRIYEFTGDA